MESPVKKHYSKDMWKTVFKYITVFVVSVSFFITILLAQVTLLALISRFTYPLVIVALLVAVMSSIAFFLKIKTDSGFVPHITLPSLFLTVLVILLLIYFPHDTFGGRDEAGYANYAVYLAQHGTLLFPQYLNYNNDYVHRIASTLPVYTSWLALNHLLFGAQWMLRSNSVLIGLGLMAFFMVASLIGGSRIGLLSSTLFASSMPFLWFSRETMTENVSFFLLWYLLLTFFTFIKTRRLVYIFALIIGGWLFALTRIEGFVIQGLLFGILFFVIFKNRLLPIRQVILIVCLYLLTLGSAVWVTSRLSFTLYVLPTLNNVRSDMINLIQPGYMASLPDSSLYRNMSKFTLTMLQKYNYDLPIFSIGIICIFMLIMWLRHRCSMKIYFIALLIISPEFIKLLNPGVTLDQPWIFRRFIYAVLPFGYISLILFIDQLLLKDKKRLPAILITFLLFVNLYLSKDILFLKNNWYLRDPLSSLSQGVTTKDFVIIRNATLGYYYPGSYLLLQKGIRSVFSSTLYQNTFVPEKKMFNGVSYNRLFLLSTQEEPKYSQFRIVPLRSITVDYDQLEPSCQLYLLGSYLNMYDTYNYSQLPYNDAVDYCKNPGNTIVKHKEKLYLYELFYQD